MPQLRGYGSSGIPFVRKGHHRADIPLHSDGTGRGTVVVTNQCGMTVGIGADDSHAFVIFQGQRQCTVIFQQNTAFHSGLISQFPMFFTAHHIVGNFVQGTVIEES